MFKKSVPVAVIVGALGYFVDIFDLFLFGVVRVASLSDLQVPKENLLSQGALLLNIQMIGLVVGGVFWGVLGDKKGRRAILFGSILLYSLANIVNASVTSVFAYAVCRFFAGLGLAGELGAAIVLVSESLSKRARGYGTTLVASLGLLGAVAAAWVAELCTWRVAYLTGGLLGLGLLILRLQLRESALFMAAEKTASAPRGSLLFLFRSRARALKFLSCILTGVPVYFVVGILILFAPEFGKALHVKGEIVVGKAVLYSYLGVALGDFSTGIWSQWAHNRKTVIRYSLLLNLLGVGLYLLGQNSTPGQFYAMCMLVGLTTGYWSVLMVLSAEQFGINCRATVTTSVPNFIRGSTVPLTLFFQSLIGSLGLILSAVIAGIGVTALAVFALKHLDETFDRDMDYLDK